MSNPRLKISNLKAEDLLEKTRGKKAVLLDFDNTLYSYEASHQAGLKMAYRTYTKIFGGISFPAFFKRYEQARKQVKSLTKNQAACHSRLLYFQSLVEAALGRTDIPKTLRLDTAYWQGYFAKMKLYPWVPGFLKNLKRRRIKILIITNQIAAVQHQKILRLKLAPWIDGLVTSEEAGVEKPDPRIFKLALQKAGCKAREALLIGDEPESDRCRFIQTLLIRN